MENRVTEKLIMENGRIKIRDLQKTDLDDLLRLTSDPDVYRYEPTYLPENLLLLKV